MQNYINQIAQLEDPSFQRIREIANSSIAHFSNDERTEFWRKLNHGVDILDSHELLCQYLWSFGNMHQAKLLRAFRKLPEELISQPFEVVDWGCGQAMATINLFDFLKTKDFDQNIRKVTLIEPSKVALERGVHHTLAYAADDVKVESINAFFENVTPEQLMSEGDLPQIHLFSNILDVAQIDLKHLSKVVDSSVISDSYLVCVGPLNFGNNRIEAFLSYFDIELVEELYKFEKRDFSEGRMRSLNTCKIKIYKLEPRQDGHLIPIEYYPPVQFQSAYELDLVGALRKSKTLNFDKRLTHFEVAAPFDLGASVYEDIHPILAVANNIVTRGLPTKASLFIEERFNEAFDLTERTVTYGEIKYLSKEAVELGNLNELFSSNLDGFDNITLEQGRNLQLLLTPVAIARFQKMLLEAIITSKLPMDKEQWRVLVEEEDVPFAALAIKDLENLIRNLAELSEEYQNAKLPKIELTIIGNKQFVESPLHLGMNVKTEITKAITKPVYDLVVTQAVLKSISESIENFSKFKCQNDCYFNIRTITDVRTQRVIYTSDRIRYRSLVKKDTQGNYIELEESKSNLAYFLQLLFRKESFRPGQLPILDRALKNQPVIGLLPTGGGKSLTYQIAALLQPGVTLVIDPLKSLMKDQFDGLINSGIDTAAYINSSLKTKEKEMRERQLESSELLFVFLSPERLAIASFRKRLRNMHDHNVYFSYGVIDEVHCVSEWGHDFRFSYLHLGRNLYNFVKAKNGEISLFGLTATASFDVLADVERELSGNGAFELDADAVVRYENTNRFELQYRIEKIPYKFAEDRYFDKDEKLDKGLPRAVNIKYGDKQSPAKMMSLNKYIRHIPALLHELQHPQNLERIKNQFAIRQNSQNHHDDDIMIKMPLDYYEKKSKYDHAGIVFCPHVSNTPMAVKNNYDGLKRNGIDGVGSFTGKDSDNVSMVNLEKFRSNEYALMVATKAFGMGIDKPNVRFTVNLNYSSSLEAFVQEAGRAGRDRKVALATIFLSDYKIVKINKNYPSGAFPLWIIKGKWFYEHDLLKIINHYKLDVPREYLMYATPASDIVKLSCNIDNKTFAYKKCKEKCIEYENCRLAKIPEELRDWMLESELLNGFRARNISYSSYWFEYYNPDYSATVYFFNNSFKGDRVEKIYLDRLLRKLPVKIFNQDKKEFQIMTGFLESMKDASFGNTIEIFIPYIEDESVEKKKVTEYDTTVNRASDLNKAIYRMCCINLIEDFTQDYAENQFRIVVSKKEPGGYFNGLKLFLQRYYTEERAQKEIDKAKEFPLKSESLNDLEQEIYRCLAYLTEFVYDKISTKRKRAIDDMRLFCSEGLLEGDDWLIANERMKDFLFYYFNSKYARADYVADNGEPFSLVDDTEGGKRSSGEILFKYLRVIDDEVVGPGTPLDNIRHLYGAVRLIGRSLTDSNPALYLLEVFCLSFIGTKGNQSLENQLMSKYQEGMIDFAERIESSEEFWILFDKFNISIENLLRTHTFSQIVEETMLLSHSRIFEKLTQEYIN